MATGAPLPVGLRWAQYKFGFWMDTVPKAWKVQRALSMRRPVAEICSLRLQRRDHS